ncbi:hypothetical protein H5410_026780 [Solanum commersonii]|uniref:Uncharacterized protein n=1 Tax=Solanum commersonii TaxID=4109 RepID=A0A9J5YZV2_SOLCO|nr:hypothetical protein H5410_026780 [Solanum commersonii]
MLLQIVYHDKATQTETEEEDTIEKILKVITTLCTKVDSMDNEIQKLKTNEDNLKSKASQQHDYKNADLRQSEDGKNPELKGDDGKLLKTHNVCLTTAAGTSKQVSDKQHKNANLNQLFEKPFTQRTPRHMSMEPQTSTYAYTPVEILYEEIKPPIQVIKIGLTKDMIILEDIEQQEEICKIEISSFYANKRIIEERPTTRALKAGFISTELLTRYCKLIGYKYPDHICSKCNGEDNIIPDIELE